MAALLTTPLRAAEKKCELQQFAQLPVTMSGTQPIIAGTINGQSVKFLVDTGAFWSLLARDTLTRLKLHEGALPYGMTISGVGGTESAGYTKANEFSLVGFYGGHIFNGMDFIVSGSAVFAGVDGIIGQNIIARDDAEYDLANGVMRLFKASGCNDHSLAYWRGNAAVAEMSLKRRTAADPHWISEAKLNGKNIRVLFDSGASFSVLNRGVAARLGITPESERATTGGTTTGIGVRSVELSLARFDTLDLGGEVIRNARIRFGDVSDGVIADLTLGSDFLLSHRLYFSSKQNKLYFTYNGGPVFDLLPKNTERDVAAVPPVVADTVADATEKSHVSAADLRRRGAASAGRGDAKGAVDLLNQAVTLDPDDAENFYERGKANLQNQQPQLALADFDQAIKLNPAYVAALIDRGAMHLASKDDTAARVDFDAALQVNHNDPDDALRIANIYEGFGFHAEAINRYTTWISANPKSGELPNVLNSRCWARAMLGKELDLALADCNLALKKGSSNSVVLDSRAFVYLRQGNYDKSIADYKTVLKLQPKMAFSMYGLAVAESRKGLKTESELHVKNAVMLMPNVAEFYNDLALIP
jgi:predicted aspartyl protease